MEYVDNCPVLKKRVKKMKLLLAVVFTMSCMVGEKGEYPPQMERRWKIVDDDCRLSVIVKNY